MPYPPTVPPATRTNSTPSADNHPADHNAISAALTEIVNQIAVMNQTVNPVGTIQMTGADAAPTNWMLCQGQVLERAAYPALFAAIGVKFNTGGESGTQFRIPAFQGRSPMGYYPGGGWAATNGAQIGTWVPALFNHAHGVDFMSQADDRDHSHHMAFNSGYADVHHSHLLPMIEGPAGGVQGAFGYGRVASIGTGGNSAAVRTEDVGAYHIHSIVGDTQGHNTGHLHRVLGNTGAAASGDSNYGNIGPSVVCNFMIRVA